MEYARRAGFQCKTCLAGKQAQLEVKQEVTLEIERKLECVEKFNYLGDMIEAGAGADESSKARVRNAWAHTVLPAPDGGDVPATTPAKVCTLNLR